LTLSRQNSWPIASCITPASHFEGLSVDNRCALPVFDCSLIEFLSKKGHHKYLGLHDISDFLISFMPFFGRLHRAGRVRSVERFQFRSFGFSKLRNSHQCATAPLRSSDCFHGKGRSGPDKRRSIRPSPSSHSRCC
jgi:hypothetical protein